MLSNKSGIDALLMGIVTSASIVLAGPSDATILQFDQIREGGVVVPTISGRGVQQDYGDRVQGATMNVAGGQFTYGEAGEGYTPNILVDYFTATASPSNPGVSLWENGYGDLTNVIFGSNHSQSLNVRLSADSGYQVQLYHFDLAGWANLDYTINAVTIFGNSVALFSQDNVLVEGDSNGPRHTVFDFAAPLTAQELLIQIDYSNLAGGQHDNIAMDNIRFGQTPPPPPVPLPPAWLLLGSGLLGILYRSLSPVANTSD